MYVRHEKAQERKLHGTGMEPTIADGQTIHVSGFGDAEPQRQDIVLYHPPGDSGHEYVGRIIALPGETVEVRNGPVYVDGEVVEEPYVANPANYAYGPTRVPDDNYFILGDNRCGATDSHSFGFVAREDITKRVKE
jgi:signal peptidase I